jgi:hypothetical protein
MLQHPENEHWQEWRKAVEKTGYNLQLSHASKCLRELEKLTPSAFESYTANLYQNLR